MENGRNENEFFYDLVVGDAAAVVGADAEDVPSSIVAR